ncbi:GHKL domain-containing protein [Lactobacillus sp. LL6]|uniref:GHKL domain-containing protein n=1 Tax=Lactobacillus sp. LL6 TaxID=2596827 RepID=UPI0011870A72|nr:GHKL domain-containing protein [Lactobacillus sp. LL6]TSO26769.1 GHKL domain-containing protein [Lactobacillus sp. LL6]
MLNNVISFQSLLIQGIGQILTYYGYVILLIILAHLGELFKRLKLPLLIISSIGAIYFQLQFGSYFDIGMSVVFSFTLTAELFLLKIPSFSKYDYGYIFLTLLFPDRIFSSALSVLGYSLVFAVLIFVLPMLIKLHQQKLKNHMLEICFSYIYLSLTAYILKLCSNITTLQLNLPFRLLRYLPFIFELITSTIIICLTYILGKHFKKFLLRLKYANLQYPKVSIWSYLLVIFTTLLLFGLNFISIIITHNVDNILISFIPIFGIILLTIELAFICLGLYLLYYRQQLSQVNSIIKSENTEETLMNLRKVRHDIKNLFFTMGSFINQSSDETLKEYFWNEIYPFAEQEISKSKIIQEFYQIPVLPLRSLLQVKSTQIIDQKIKFDVNINIKHFFLGIEIIDLSRILGILIDNAIEESKQLNDGEISLSIKEIDNEISYIIKNKVHVGFSMENILQHKTSKVGHHGLGLQIVQDIVNNYSNLNLNTFKNGNYLIQAINIEK